MTTAKKKQPKYFAKKVRTSTGIFDSMAEYKYWQKLQLLQRAGIITEIQRQVPFPIIVNGHKITKYIADFVVTYSNGITEIHDAKNPYLIGAGKSTPAGQIFRLKQKLMFAVHGIEIKTEIK